MGQKILSVRYIGWVRLDEKVRRVKCQMDWRDQTSKNAQQSQSLRLIEWVRLVKLVGRVKIKDGWNGSD